MRHCGQGLPPGAKQPERRCGQRRLAQEIAQGRDIAPLMDQQAASGDRLVLAAESPTLERHQRVNNAAINGTGAGYDWTRSKRSLAANLLAKGLVRPGPHPDVVSLEQFEHFLKEAEAQGLMIWLAGVQADLLESFRCLGFSAWLPNQRIFPQGSDADSATLAAIRGIRAELKANTSHAEDRLYYLV